MNDELRHMCEATTGQDPDATRRLAEAEKRIGNIWTAIEEGLTDTATANARLRALQTERDELQEATVVVGEPPQIDPQVAMAYQRQAEKTSEKGRPTEQKQVLRAWQRRSLSRTPSSRRSRGLRGKQDPVGASSNSLLGTGAAVDGVPVAADAHCTCGGLPR